MTLSSLKERIGVNLRSWESGFRANATLLIGIVVVVWGIEVLDTVAFGYFDRFGIHPRKWAGLAGIVTAPFLHGGFGHLASNTVPFVVLGAILLAAGRKRWMAVSLFVVLVGGLLVWLLGPPGSNHIGASLVIFGYLGYLLTRGVFERHWGWIVIAVVVAALYGGTLFGVLPGKEGVSWQGHLFGFVAGVAAVRVLPAPDRRGIG